MSYLSICIPTYEMKGMGHVFLRQSFDVLVGQTFADFDVVVSDHSKDNAVEQLCEEYKAKIKVHYYRNEEQRGNYSFNLNTAIKKAEGSIIKVLLQDDFLADERSLETIVNNFDLTKDGWLVTGCIHTRNRTDRFLPFHPKYNRAIQYGRNTLGSPTVLAVRNQDPLFFDEKLIWLNDCDYYKRCYARFGAPKIVPAVCSVVGVGDHQITNTIAGFRLREREFHYIAQKYRNDIAAYPGMVLAYIKLLIKHLL
jgi:glycosyltransferase involved in cell wall biosynthesis